MRIKNGLVVGVILLFVGVAVQPSIAINPISSDNEEEEIEPKDYLFQTIIDIANNPDVKSLLEQYNHKIFTSNYDYKGIFSKLLIREPRLLFNVLFTRPSFTYDFLDKSYNRGIEITNIIGEDNVLEMIASIEVTNPKLFNEFNNIIMNNEELSKKLVTLKEINEEIKLDEPLRYHFVICSILTIFAIPVLLYLLLLELTFFNFPNNLENPIFIGIVACLGLIILPFTLLLITLVEVFNCI